MASREKSRRIKQLRIIDRARPSSNYFERDEPFTCEERLNMAMKVADHRVVAELDQIIYEKFYAPYKQG